MDRERWIARNERRISMVVIPVGAVAGFLLFFVLTRSVGWGFAGYFLLAVVMTIIVPLWLKVQLNRAQRHLREECDPQAFLELLELRIANIRKAGPYLQALQINQAVCRGKLGDPDGAMAIYETMDIDQYPGTIPYVKAIYYIDLASGHIDRGDFLRARIWLDKAGTIHSHQKYALPLVKSVGDALAENQAILDMRQGRYDGVESVLHRLFDTADCRLKRVEARHALAELYRRTGRIEEERECLRYVVENGNRLHAVEEAKARLEEIS